MKPYITAVSIKNLKFNEINEKEHYNSSHKSYKMNDTRNNDDYIRNNTCINKM